MTQRYNTRVICKVHSHIQREDNGILDLSKDIVTFRTSKSIKGTGGMSFTLMPRRNYLNLLFPNDVVNLYVDVGDGKGFVRLFFGYLDRIERTENVGENGQMNTAFAITCTDFMKAVDKTDVVFNPHLANRAEFSNNDLGLSQLGGGHALRTKGITAHGTPAQFVENILELLLGFGTQWKLPTSYPTSTFLQASRNARRQRAIARLPKQVQNTLSAQFGINVNDIGLNSDIQQELLNQQNSLNASLNTDSNGFTDVSDYYAKQAALSEVLAASVDLQAYQMALQTTQSSAPASILDILSLDFIEALAIDGFIASSGVWTGDGTIASLIYGWTNDIVNELCFDLRPVTVNSPDQCFGTQYSRDPDDLGINTDGTEFLPSSVHAVQYVPAVVMREFPYSTVEGLDLTNYYILGTPAGFQPFGPIFAQGVGVEGRQIYNYESAGISALTPEKCSYDSSGRPFKHLDVVTIVDQDVTSSQLGRSDQDIINFFDITSSDAIGKIWAYVLNDIMPIITPVSIERHGLRRQSLWTKFANYSRDQLCAAGSSAVDSAAVRRNLVRWALLVDHWYQHNAEYLSGTITMRGRADIRVGYRLDWLGRNESYYVEHVQQQWEFMKPLTTTVQVSRGQRNDTYPAYIPPILSKTSSSGGNGGTNAASPATDQQNLQRAQANQTATQGGGNRFSDGRLAEYFYVRDTRATSFSVGGSANYSADNFIDDPANVPGPAEFAGTVSNRERVSASQTIDDLNTDTFGPTVFDAEPTDNDEGND